MVEYIEWGIFYINSEDIANPSKTLCTLLKGSDRLSKMEPWVFFDSQFWPDEDEHWSPQRELEDNPGIYYWSGKIRLYKEATEYVLPLKNIEGVWKSINMEKLTPELFI